MPTWMRVAAIGVLLLVALVAAAPLGYAGFRFVQVRSGQALRFGLRVESATGAPLSGAERDRAVTVLAARLVKLGLLAPVVRPTEVAGENVEVLLPAVQDPERVKRLLQAESNLELRPVVGEPVSGGYPTREAALASAAAESHDVEALPYIERDGEAGASQPTGYLPISKQAIVRAEDIRDAVAAPDQFRAANYQITFTLKAAAAQSFGEWTEKNIGHHLAIVLNGRVRSAPRIQSKITDRGQITGNFTQEMAEDLANVLTSGQLPGRVTIVSEALTASDYWSFRYGVVAACSAAVVAACGAGVVAVVWPVLRRRIASPRMEAL